MFASDSFFISGAHDTFILLDMYFLYEWLIVPLLCMMGAFRLLHDHDPLLFVLNDWYKETHLATMFPYAYCLNKIETLVATVFGLLPEIIIYVVPCLIHIRCY